MNHQEIWEVVSSIFSSYTEEKILADDVSPKDPILKYFPSKNPQDMEDRKAFLFSQCLCDILDNINEMYATDLKFDFLIREEWELFQTVGHVYMYFIYLLEEKGV